MFLFGLVACQSLGIGFWLVKPATGSLTGYRGTVCSNENLRFTVLWLLKGKVRLYYLKKDYHRYKAKINSQMVGGGQESGKGVSLNTFCLKIDTAQRWCKLRAAVVAGG